MITVGIPNAKSQCDAGPVSFFDDYGYPTEAFLAWIRTYPGHHDWTIEQVRSYDWQSAWSAFIQAIKAAWAYAEWGWSERDGRHWHSGHPTRVFSVSTAGWSGNEAIIEALRENHLFWTLHWVSSRRGGHHEFEFLLPSEGVAKTDAPVYNPVADSGAPGSPVQVKTLPPSPIS